MRKAGERARRRAFSGAVLQELKEEYLGAPAEDMHDISEKQVIMGRENKRKIDRFEVFMTFICLLCIYKSKSFRCPEFCEHLYESK